MALRNSGRRGKKGEGVCEGVTDSMKHPTEAAWKIDYACRGRHALAWGGDGSA